MLVFAIQFHDPLGVLIVPYLVQQAKDGRFMIGTQRLYGHTVAGYIDSLSDVEKQLMTLTDECSDPHLCKKFSKSARNAEALYSELSESKLKSLVMPYTQIRISKCLQLMQEHGMMLYFKGEKDNAVDGEQILLPKKPAKAVFHFIKDEQGLRYKLGLKQEGVDIPLSGEGSLVLVNEPGWVLVNQMVYRLEDGVEGNKVKPFFNKEFVSIPASFEEKYFKGFMLKVIKKHEVKLEGIRLDVESPPCRPVLKLELDLEGHPILMLYFQYSHRRCQLTDTNTSWAELLSDDGRHGFKKMHRDLAAEERYIQALRGMGLTSRGKNSFLIPDKADANRGRRIAMEGHGSAENKLISQKQSSLFQLIEWMGRHAEDLKALGFSIEQDFLETTYYPSIPLVEMNISAGNDWFDIYAVAVFGEYRIPFIQLKNHLLNGIREYELPDGRVAILPEEWFSRYNKLLVYGQTLDGNLRMRKHHFRLVEQLKPHLESLPEGMDIGSAEPFTMPELPPTLDQVLRPYQRAGYAWLFWLYRNGFGGCLADDMGLGKTLQTLALLLKLKVDARQETQQETQQETPYITIRHSGDQLSLFGDPDNADLPAARTSLIIMPLSLVYNWENEIRRFAPDLRYMKYLGSDREADVEMLLQYDIVLTTYGTVRNDAELLKNLPFCFVVLDESQLIKNPKSQVSEAVNMLNAEHRLVLTGTPIENSLDDLWSQLSFVNPGMLGSLSFFRKVFVQPIEGAGDQLKKAELNEMIKPFILRRTKDQVEPDLPELTEKIHYCEMGEEQRSLYETKKSEMRNHLLEVMASGDRSRLKINVLQSLLQLRLLANHPKLVKQVGTLSGTQADALLGNQADAIPENQANATSGKFEEVIRMTENLMAEGHKVLIFSQFVKHLHLFRDYFEHNGLSHAWLTGQQKAGDREKTITDFQNDPDKLLFLVSLKAGGVGLNLTAADYVFILDPWWNPAVEKQAVSRAHRIGQHRHVFSYKFITTNSVEEKILSLQQAKAHLAGDFISSNNPFKGYSDEEILEIFE